MQTRYFTPQNGQNCFGYSYKLVSNPYLTGSEQSDGWTLATMDQLGRVTAVQNYAEGPSSPPPPWNGSACSGTTSTGTATASYGVGTPSTTNPYATTTTATDEAGNQRVQYTDGLGRLIQVTENGSENSVYTYNALDDLTGTSIPGENARSFNYSSLSRLIGAYNLESDYTCYTYDGNGNPLARTLGASGCSLTSGAPISGGITTNYTYDALNQLLSKTYSDSTPGVTYSYVTDWLQTATVSGGTVTKNIAFDDFGRVTSSSQKTNWVTYTFPLYQYNLADSLTSVTYPSGRVVNTIYNAANQPNSLAGNLGGNQTTYVSSVGYAPHGAITSLQLGNSLWSASAFNSRLQTTSMSLGTTNGVSNIWGLTNTFSSTQNNGNVQSQALSVPGVGGTINTTYTYDSVNRLTVAAEFSPGVNPSGSCPNSSSFWCRQYSYNSPGHGNRLTSGSSGQGLSLLEPPGFNSNNQITGSGWSYTETNNVQRGNVTQTPGPATMSYDAENRQTTYNSSGQTTTYFYDGEGHRVMSQGPNGTAVFVYDASGNLASEFDSQSSGPLCNTCYVTGDHLGSTRVVTSGAADLQPGCAVFRQDYLPFGEQILTSGGQPRASATGGTPCTANGYLTLAMPLREQFTGQQIDPESTLNFFQVRYFAGGAGRFMSPDPASTFVADPSSPQSWNLYGYVLNNPLAYIDPTGLDACNNGVDADGNPCFSVTGTGSSGSGGSDGGSSGGGGLDCFFSPFLCGGGPGGPGAGPGGPGGTPVFTTTVTTTAPGSQSKPTPTFGSCMESHASDFSMAGFLNNGLAAAGRTNLQPGNTFLGSAIGGNNLTGAYFAIFGNSNQSTSNALTTAANQGLVGDVGLVGAIGTNLTSGARTSSIFSLNLAGKPGTGAQVLARSPALRKTLGRIGTVGKITTIIDAGLALGEAIDCAAGVLR